MDRTFHANLLGATIAAAAAICREHAVPALTVAAEQLEAEARRSGVESPYARQAEASRAALRRIARHEPLVTLSVLDTWPWPVDSSG
jgi:hypothetical protein